MAISDPGPITYVTDDRYGITVECGGRSINAVYAYTKVCCDTRGFDGDIVYPWTHFWDITPENITPATKRCATTYHEDGREEQCL
jgi:hypothetical protein